MKKVLLISASTLALSAGAALAQTNSSNLYQNGSYNGAAIGQTLNSATSNGSDVYQGINGNGRAANNSSVSVTQIGGTSTTNYSQIIQNDFPSARSGKTLRMVAC